jgi:hypothetical protein
MRRHIGFLITPLNGLCPNSAIEENNYHKSEHLLQPTNPSL